jgi:hypothetical protein
MRGVVPPSEDAVRTPTPVLRVGEIVAGDLGLAGLRGLRNANWALDFDSVFRINNVVAIVHVSNFLTRRQKYIGIVKVVPSFSSRSAPMVLRARS